MSYCILFVCSGNTCRSAMAAYLAADIADKKYPAGTFCFDSAGLATADGYPASENAVAVMEEWGIDLHSHRSKKFQPYMMSMADCVVCMTAMHKDILTADFPEAKEKIFLIGEASGTGKDIPDPYMGSLSLYRQTRDKLKEEITSILTKLAASR